MKKEIGIVLIALFLLIQTVMASPIGEITKDVPNTTVAGSTYELQYKFDNNKPINLTIFFNITNPNPEATVNPNDFTTKIKLNNNNLSCNETLGGMFKCEEQSVSQTGTNNVSVNLSSRIDLQPSENYTFELGLWIIYEFEEEIIEEKKYVRGGGGGGAIIYPTPTPTLTSTPEITPTPEPEVTPEPTATPKPTPTPVISEEPEIPKGLIVGIVALIIALLVIFLYLMHREEEEE